jgi:hypothetical protein
MFFLILPDSTRAKHSTSIHCKGILSCYWNHLQLWMCIQNATRFDLQNSVILEGLRPQHRSVGDFVCSWKLCTLLWKPLYHISTAVVLSSDNDTWLWILYAYISMICITPMHVLLKWPVTCSVAGVHVSHAKYGYIVRTRILCGTCMVIMLGSC